MLKCIIFICLLFVTGEAIGQFERVKWKLPESEAENQIQLWQNDSIKIKNEINNGKLVRYQYFENGRLQLKVEIRQESEKSTFFVFDEIKKNEVTDTLEEKYFIDYPNGDYIEYFPNGNQKCKGLKRNGINVGEWSFFGENGNTSKIINYNEEGYKLGRYEEYYENEILKEIGEYGIKRVIEKTKCFDPNTFTEYDCEIDKIMELKIGNWKYYNEQGELLKK